MTFEEQPNAYPELLGQVLKNYLGPAGKPSDALTVILRQLLRKYKTQYAVKKDQDVEELAELIEGSKLESDGD